MWTVPRFILLGAVLLVCNAEDAPLSPQLVSAVNSFSLDLFRKVATAGKNSVVSPISVETLLALLQQGAEGNTQTQLTKVLGVDREQSKKGYSQITRQLKETSPNLTLEFANGAFLKPAYQVKQAFRNVLVNDFLASVQNVDFSKRAAAAKTINSWVAQHTHDKITQLVSEDNFDDSTRFVLTNAIYFKGLWETSFKKSNTKDLDFYTQPDTAKKVPTMYLKSKFAIGNLDNLNARWLSLPFQGDRFSLIILLPNEKDGLANLQKSITAADLTRVIQSAKTEYKPEVELLLPKFKFESTLELNEPLRELGLSAIFDGANFSGISQEPVAVSEVLQKANIEVNEEGATAAAATAVIMTKMSLGINERKPVVFKADHPFLATIIDVQSRMPLFLSNVQDPSA